MGHFPPPPSPRSQHFLFLQLEQLPSHQSILTHISTSGLPTSLGGGLPYCHQAWLDFRMVSVLDRAEGGKAGNLASRGTSSGLA